MADDNFMSCTQHQQNATNQMEHLDKHIEEAENNSPY